MREGGLWAQEGIASRNGDLGSGMETEVGAAGSLAGSFPLGNAGPASGCGPEDTLWPHQGKPLHYCSLRVPSPFLPRVLGHCSEVLTLWATCGTVPLPSRKTWTDPPRPVYCWMEVGGKPVPDPQPRAHTERVQPQLSPHLHGLLVERQLALLHTVHDSLILQGI